MKNLLKIMLTASLCVSASIAAPQKGSMTDPRDGKTYKTVKIGDQVWMAENLALEITEINGNPGSTNVCFSLASNGKKVNCKKYGQFYSALAASVACPDGWRLPSAAEFKKLLDYTGNSIDLKSKKRWNTYQQPSGNGKDKYGFNALPSGGCIVAQDGECAYLDEGNYAYFWTSSMQSDPLALVYAFLGAPHADYGFDIAPQKEAISIWYPVRCIQDEKKNVGDGLAGLLSGNANGNEQKKSTDSNEGSCSNSDVLDLTILLKDDYVQIGARGGFQPEIYFNEMWTFRCKANGQRVTYSAKDVQENLGRGYGPKCPNGKEISPDKYINELEKIELWTIENESADTLVEDMLMNELSIIYNQFKNLEDAGKITIFIDDKRNHDMKWIKKKYGPILNKIQKLGFKEIYFPSDVESSMRSETEDAIFYDSRFVIKYDDAHANQLYKTFGVRKPSKADFAKENKRCHNSLVTIEMKNEQAFKEKMDKAFKDSAAVNKILMDVVSKMSKEKDPSESSGGGIGDGLAGLLSGNANDNDQKESADFNEGDATESSSHDACKAAVAKAKNTFNRCKTFPKESSERSLCAKKYKKEKENAEKACIIKNAKNSCSRSASDIMEVVRQRMPGLRHIYNKFLKQQPHFQGVVSLRFTIAPGGEIISISIASSTTGYGEFDNEIKTAVSRWNFGKFKCDDGNVANETTVTIPFTFSE